MSTLSTAETEYVALVGISVYGRSITFFLSAADRIVVYEFLKIIRGP